MILLIPLGLIGAALGGVARRALGRAATGVIGAITGKGATAVVRSSAARAAKAGAAVAVLPGGKVVRNVLGGAAAGAVGEMVVSRAATPGPVMVGGVNINPWASTTRKRYRKINPLNPKALKRSMRRLEGFGEFAKAMGYSRPPKCIGGFKGLPKRKRATKCR